MRQLVRGLKLSAAGIEGPVARIGGAYASGLESSKDLFSIDHCQGCCSRRRMSSIPQSAHAATKVHVMMSEAHWAPGAMMADDAKTFGHEKDAPTSWQTWINQFMDHPLAKYNSKMMNSIWGLYNRYSVHNFKRVTEEEVKGKAGDWVTTVAFNQKSQDSQPTQAVSTATNVGLPATAFPTASASVRDANPLHSFWFSSHHH